MTLTNPHNSFLRSIIIILNILLLSYSCTVNHTNILNHSTEIPSTQMHNSSEIRHEYTDNTPLLGKVNENFRKFKETLSNLFHHGNISDSDRIHQQLSEFHKTIQNYFFNYFPEERNVSDTLDRFAHRFTDYLKKVNTTSDRGLLVIERFYDFTKKNFSDFEEENESDRDITERFNKFIERIENYLGYSNDSVRAEHGNQTEFNLTKGRDQEPTYFVIYERRHYLPKYSLCSSNQIDACRLKCKEEDKILCGCFNISNINKGDTIECLCADKPSLCLTHHSHVEISDNRKDLNKDL